MLRAGFEIYNNTSVNDGCGEEERRIYDIFSKSHEEKRWTVENNLKFHEFKGPRLLTYKVGIVIFRRLLLYGLISGELEIDYKSNTYKNIQKLVLFW